MDFQVQNTTRCAGNIESSDPTVLSAITTEGNSILVTRQRKVKLREIEEDLHIGIYLLILVIVVVLCLSFVILTVLLTRKCDKKKGASKQGNILIIDICQSPTANMVIRITRIVVASDELKVSI